MHRQRTIFSSRLVAALFAIVAILGLSACTDPASLAMSGASVVTFVSTGKTLTDHAMSLATDQDCSLKRSLEGKSWCEPAENVAAADIAGPELYCYRSIAEVTCYRRRNPNDTKTRQTFAPAAAPGTQRPTAPELAGNSETGAP